MKKQPKNSHREYYPDNLRIVFTEYLFNELKLSNSELKDRTLITVFDVITWLKNHYPLEVKAALLSDGSIYLIKDGKSISEGHLLEWEAPYVLLHSQPHHIFVKLYNYGVEHIDNFFYDILDYKVLLNPYIKSLLLNKYRYRLMEFFGKDDHTIENWLHNDDPALTQYGALCYYTQWLNLDMYEIINVIKVQQ